MKKVAISFSVLAVTLAAITSCSKPEPKPPVVETNEEPALPSKPFNYFTRHAVDDDVATLGRVLFYDKQLSVNNAVSCGSCHKQEFAFADNVRFNHGFNGLELKRNSPSIQGIRAFAENGFNRSIKGIPNAANQIPVLLFWDGRQTNAANMVLNPVVNHNEMNMPDLESLVQKLRGISYYPPLFKKAFGTDLITKDNIAFALEGFICCLNTENPNFSRPFEPVLQQPAGTATFATLEEAGEFLFHNKYNCAQCHDPSHRGGYGGGDEPSQMFDIGLDQTPIDAGRGGVTNIKGDNGLFKVPTLKNISVTGPYMHDGRFANLGQVLDHYSHGIQQSAGLSRLLKNSDGTAKQMNILPSEKQAIIAFLNTLRDDDFITSVLYSDPFKK
jgi:cytochrome c peroxidase